MTLPVSGSISLRDVNLEFVRSAGTAISLNDTDVRSLFAKLGAATTNSLNDGRGKAYYQIGSVTNFTVVNFGTFIRMNIDVTGANPYAAMTLELFSTDSGQALGTISIGSCNGSGFLSYLVDVYSPDPYWFPAPITNRYTVWQDVTHSLGNFAVSS